MRLVAAALVAFGVAAAAPAQPVSTAPLAANELLLEVQAMGTSDRPADRARLQVLLTARAATEEEARVAVDRLVGQATSAARTAGVAAADIRPLSRAFQVGFVSEPPPDEYMLPAEVAAQMQQAQRVAHRRLDILIRDPAAVERIRASLSRAGIDGVSEPIYEVDDVRAARREARAAALAGARADADDYAAAMRMRVSRILRVSERVDASTGWTVFAPLFQGAYAQPRTEARQVETRVHVEVDFALAPQ